MAVSEFKEKVLRLKSALKLAAAKNIDLSQDADQKKKIYDFKAGQLDYHKVTVFKAVDDIVDYSLKLNSIKDFDEGNEAFVVKIRDLANNLHNIEDKQKSADEMLELAGHLREPEKKELKLPSTVPADIRDELFADIQELERCMDSKCYRSAVILCGRLLEIALHRKYFDTTGTDILEKNPGIGLGTLIAKLSEKNVKFDPGLTNQIHLINQTRISSVHKKKETFYPSEAQAQAMLLYTLDILSKIFKKEDQGVFDGIA